MAATLTLTIIHEEGYYLVTDGYFNVHGIGNTVFKAIEDYGMSLNEQFRSLKAFDKKDQLGQGLKNELIGMREFNKQAAG